MILAVGHTLVIPVNGDCHTWKGIRSADVLLGDLELFWGRLP
jgi:hypothetical protein